MNTRPKICETGHKAWILECHFEFENIQNLEILSRFRAYVQDSDPLSFWFESNLCASLDLNFLLFSGFNPAIMAEWSKNKGHLMPL